MGLADIQDTELYTFIRACIPSPKDVMCKKIYEPYSLKVQPMYLKILGTMCDYGVRARSIHRDFGHIQYDLCNNKYGDNTELVESLIESPALSASEAYLLATYTMPRNLSDDFYNDYNILTERAVAMYRHIRVEYGYYGKCYNLPGNMRFVECDCMFDKGIVDMKVSRSDAYKEMFWTQVVLYSFIAKSTDSLDRRQLYLLYPVQGVVKYFVYPEAQYKILYTKFMEGFKCI